MTTTDDGSQLLAAIVATPEDDTVRLAYADALQENGQDDRAELIRLQISFVTDPYPRLLPPNDPCTCTSDVGFVEYRKHGHYCGACQRIHEPFNREKELRAAHPEWSSVKCPACGGNGVIPGNRACRTCIVAGDLLRSTGSTDPADFDERGHTLIADLRPIRWSRGFIEAVEARSGEVWEARCPGCKNVADGYGWITCSCGVAWPRETAPTPWARAIVAAIPTLREIRLTGDWIVRRADGIYYITGEVPEPITRNRLDQFATFEAARTALARSVCEWARRS